MQKSQVSDFSRALSSFDLRAVQDMLRGPDASKLISTPVFGLSSRHPIEAVVTGLFFKIHKTMSGPNNDVRPTDIATLIIQETVLHRAAIEKFIPEEFGGDLSSYVMSKYSTNCPVSVLRELHKAGINIRAKFDIYGIAEEFHTNLMNECEDHISAYIDFMVGTGLYAFKDFVNMAGGTKRGGPFYMKSHFVYNALQKHSLELTPDEGVNFAAETARAVLMCTQDRNTKIGPVLSYSAATSRMPLVPKTDRAIGILFLCAQYPEVCEKIFPNTLCPSNCLPKDAVGMICSYLYRHAEIDFRLWYKNRLCTSYIEDFFRFRASLIAKVFKACLKPVSKRSRSKTVRAYRRVVKLPGSVVDTILSFLVPCPRMVTDLMDG